MIDQDAADQIHRRVRLFLLVWVGGFAVSVLSLAAGEGIHLAVFLAYMLTLMGVAFAAARCRCPRCGAPAFYSTEGGDPSALWARARRPRGLRCRTCEFPLLSRSD